MQSVNIINTAVFVFWIHPATNLLPVHPGKRFFFFHFLLQAKLHTRDSYMGWDKPNNAAGAVYESQCLLILVMTFFL